MFIREAVVKDISQIQIVRNSVKENIDHSVNTYQKLNQNTSL